MAACMGIGVIEDEALQDLAVHLTREWKDLARKLAIIEGVIYDLERDHDYSSQERIYQMLLTWKRQEGPKATRAALGQALNIVGRADLADRLHRQLLVE